MTGETHTRIHVVRAEKSKAQKQPVRVIVEMHVHLCLRQFPPHRAENNIQIQTSVLHSLIDLPPMCTQI